MSLYNRNFHVPDPSWKNGPDEDDEYDEAIDDYDEQDLIEPDEPSPAELEEGYDKALDDYERNLDGRY